jgi:hypothetical protein
MGYILKIYSKMAVFDFPFFNQDNAKKNISRNLFQAINKVKYRVYSDADPKPTLQVKDGLSPRSSKLSNSLLLYTVILHTQKILISCVKSLQSWSYINISRLKELIAMAINFFEVKAKCGHVGRGNYYEGIFHIKAENAKEAAAKGRLMPRVKHDHKDAILSVTQLTYEEFKAGCVERDNIPYYQCSNKQEQSEIYEAIAYGIVEDPAFLQERPAEDYDRKERLSVLRRMERKTNKYRNYYEPIGA